MSDHSNIMKGKNGPVQSVHETQSEVWCIAMQGEHYFAVLSPRWGKYWCGCKSSLNQ